MVAAASSQNDQSNFDDRERRGIFNEGMAEREQNSIALPKEMWAEIAARAKTNRCDISDIIERALAVYFNATGTPEPGEST